MSLPPAWERPQVGNCVDRLTGGGATFVRPKMAIFINCVCQARGSGCEMILSYRLLRIALIDGTMALPT